MAEEQSPAKVRETLIDSLRELWLTEADLSFLHEVSPEVLSRIVAEAQAHAKRTHEGQRRLYEVMARATRFIPNFVIVKMANTLSPYILAQVTEHLEVKTAASMAKSFDAELLGQIVLHIDTRTAVSIAQLTDLDTLEKITDVLHRKGLSKRLGEVSDALDEPMLEKLVNRIRDAERIAAVAAHMRNYDKLGNIARRLETKLLSRVVEVLQRHGHVQAAKAMR